MPVAPSTTTAAPTTTPTPAAPSHLVDLLEFGLAQALIASAPDDPRPLDLLQHVIDTPFSPDRALASYLRAQHLERLGRLDDAQAAYRATLSRWPDAAFARELRTRLRASNDAVSALPSTPPAWVSAPTPQATLLLIAHAAPWLATATHDAATSRSQPSKRKSASSKKKSTASPTPDDDPTPRATGNALYDEALTALRKAHRNKRSKAYLTALGDLAYDFARYDDALAAWNRAFGKRSPGESYSERIAHARLRSGDPNNAAKHWSKLGKTRGASRNLYERYWYARALLLDKKSSAAHAVFEGLVADAPLDYYGLQAWSRLQELDQTIPPTVEPPAPTVPRKKDESPSCHATVGWTPESLVVDWTRAPQPDAARDTLATAFAASWGTTCEEAARAAELITLGDLTRATAELRVIDMDLRSAGASSATIQRRTSSTLLDNRRSPRAPGGASMTESSQNRKNSHQAAKFKSNRVHLRSDLRELQVALGDPYALRRAALEATGPITPAVLASDAGSDLYPLAYPDVVSRVAAQLAIPAYFIYAIMTVESGFHPGAVSVASAYGLVQVIPSTGAHLARELGVLDFTPERLLDPGLSVYFGGYYLARLLARFHGQEPLAAAAYNAGPHRVAVWLAQRGTLPMDMFIEDIPYRQARGYVKTMLRHLHAYRRVYHAEDHLYIRNDIDTMMGDEPNY